MLVSSTSDASFEESKRTTLSDPPSQHKDFFEHPPLVPEHWALLRRVVQALLGLALLVGPSWILSSAEVLGDNLAWSVFVIFLMPLVVVALGLRLRRRSRIAGTLLAAGAAIHFVGYLLMTAYVYWLVRSL